MSMEWPFFTSLGATGRMSTTEETILPSDAWLLASIYGASLAGKATLAQVIGMGDFLNRAIFTLAELNGGLSRLQRAGLISVRGETYRLTRKGQNITEIDPKAKKGAFEHMETIRKRLGAGDWGPRIDPNSVGDPLKPVIYVSEDGFRRACDDYQQTFAQGRVRKTRRESQRREDRD
jgi:hypothetical protein